MEGVEGGAENSELPYCSLNELVDVDIIVGAAMCWCASLFSE